jgi:tripartite-type tricarboxylate transporter receptor subunit TctC
LLAPPGTPAPIITRLNQETVRFINTPEAKEKFFSAGFEVEGGSPEELGAWIKSETARWGKVIKDAGLRVN